jgi:hypothetical protein
MEWHDAHYQKSEDPTFNDDLGGFYHKLKGYCARFALIHQLFTDPASETVGVESLSFGCDVADYFAGQAANVFPKFLKVRVSPQARCEGEIRRVLERQGAMTKRNLQRNCNAEAVVFNPVLDSLLAIGSVKEQQDKLALVSD